jgi:peptidyl-dipeptidase Dcp
MFARVAIFSLAVALAAVGPAAVVSAPVNPLLAPSILPFGVPMFDRIKDTDYEPAFNVAIKEHLRELQAIANNPAPPTFENTLVAMEKSGRTLDRVQAAFDAVSQANTNPTLQHVQEVEAPKLAAYYDAIYLNPKLFARVRTVYRERNKLKLDPESRRLLQVYYGDFARAGANLKPADQSALRTLNQQLSVLGASFTRKLLAGTAAGALVLDNAAQLAGLSEPEIAAAALAATSHHLDGKWLIPLQNTTQQPALQQLNDRSVREQLFEHSVTRTEKGDANDTRAVIARMAQLRAQKARILGYRTYADYSLADEMAKSPATVQRFLTGMIPATRAKVLADAAELQAAMDAAGVHAPLQPYDWQHYAEAVRKAKYNLDDNDVRPYFEINNVLQNGLFYAATQMYGITFKERHDIPVYNPDVRVFEVFDQDGSSLALMYFDFFKRDNKGSGAWMATFVGQSTLLGTKPAVYNVENFTKPAAGQPALLSASDVGGMFHEFGHALNGMFSKEKYPSLAGTGRARDFVEYPSQFNEHWAMHPAFFKHYAVHYKTGEPMPQALVDKMQAAANFNKAYSLAEILAADELDLAWHSLPPGAARKDVDRFETQALVNSHTDFPSVPPRYRSSYFQHIWGGGYAAGYYAYMWSEMLDDDTYQWFMDHGGPTRANGQRFRDLILSRGDSQDYAAMFRAFYGKDPDVGPLLQERGLPH